MKIRIIAAALCLALPGVASAALISVTPSPAGTGNNLIYNACDDPRPAAINQGVVGCLNARPDTYVYVYSNEPLQTPSGGQARVNAVDSTFGVLTIAFVDPDMTFTTLIFNINADTDGTVDFSSGISHNVSGNGQNFFTLQFDPGVNSYTFMSTVGAWIDVRQVRFAIDGVLVPVPEPTSLALLGLGLLGMGLARRRRSA